jgi:class 3 adenylate cyclase/predicted ATPase
MRTATKSELPPIYLTVRLEGAVLVVFLTDGRAVSRHASGRYDETVLQSLSDASCDLSPGSGHARAAAAELCARLFPGEVGDYLFHSASRELNLQLTPKLDRLAWERAWDGATYAGEKFRMTRCLLEDEGEGADGAAPVMAPRHGRLRVLRVLPGERLSSDHTFISGAAGPIEWHCCASLGALAMQEGLDELQRHELVHFLGVSPEHAAALLSSRPQDADGPRLFAISGSADSALHGLVSLVRRCGYSLLVAPQHAGSDRDLGWLGATCDALNTGCSVGEAVRRVRATCGEDRIASLLRLYGVADQALVVPPEASHTTHDNLRQLTSLSCDLVDSTGWLHRLGGERYAELLASFHERSAAVVRRCGGVPDEPQGDDGVMSYFGYPLADEHASEQAVLAGLEIVKAVATLGVFSVRVGIATGRVTVKAGQPVGVSIHLAARLQKAAVPGEVLISRITRELVKHRFELQELPQALALKGIDAWQKAYRVLSDHRTTGRLESSRLTPFVGREFELGALGTQWNAACGGSTRVVLIKGEAGIGKSRLMREFRLELQRSGQESLECRCQADGSVSAFRALIDMLKRLLSFHGQDDTMVRIDKIVRGLPPGMAPAKAVPLIAALLSVPLASRYPALLGVPEALRQRTFSVLAEWFRCAARVAPICLVVEDIQWIDPSTREFLGQLVAQAEPLPLLVLLTQRAEADIDWPSPMVHQTIELRGLPPPSARWLLAQACGDSSLPADIVRMLAQRADGVPLFLEESARMAIELGARGDDNLQLLHDVPTTLEDLLMARLDGLGRAKAAAQLGAVIGREFPVSLLTSVRTREGIPSTRQELDASLAVLERSGLLIRGGGPEDLRYTFKHVLVRDTAYQSLWERDRRRIHRAVAASLREDCPELAEQQPELLAKHQTEAGLDADALTQWEVAARRAASRSAHDESISHLQCALALLARQPEVPERDRIELRLQLLLASRYIAIEGYGADRVERVYARAAQLCETLGDHVARLKVELGLEGYHFMRADFVRARELAQHSARMAADLPDPMGRLQANWAMASILFHEGDGMAALKRMDECLARYRPDQHRRGGVQDPGVMCLCYSAWGQWDLGYPDDALRRIDRVVALAGTLEHKFSLGEAYGFAAYVYGNRGDIDSAMAFAEEGILICEDRGFAVWLAHARVMHGRVLCERGRVAEGLAEMREGYAMWVRTGAVVTRPFYLAMQAEGFAFDGAPGKGLALLAEALRIAQAHGERYFEAEVRRLIAELTLQQALQEGEDARAQAERWLLSAFELAGRQGKRAFALRSAMSLARLWGECGRRRDAAALLGPALAWFSEGHGTRDLLAAHDLFDSLADSAEVTGEAR